MPSNPAIPRPYRLEFAHAKQPGTAELVWRRHPTTTFATPEGARRRAEELMQRRWWIVSYRVIGPDGEVPWPPGASPPAPDAPGASAAAPPPA
jgi:hypothetical protein